MASPDDENAPNIQEKKRGVTVMKEVARARSRGVKLEAIIIYLLLQQFDHVCILSKHIYDISTPSSLLGWVE